jgi:hypothetical protein
MVGMLATEHEHVSGSKPSNSDAEAQGKLNKAARKANKSAAAAAAAAEAAAAEARAQEDEANDGNVA